MNSIFENLFVLELANNHWGSLDRGMEIVEKFSTGDFIVKCNSGLLLVTDYDGVVGMGQTFS